MPAGGQSLNAWLGLVNSSQTAAAYKSGIDANSSIAGGVAGSLYVYPNSPTGLSVLVDPAFNLFSSFGGGLNGGFILFNTAASPIAVTLTAPTANSYYATVYWNPIANTAGVVYGATSTTPFPILPDNAAFIPLACVLLSLGQLNVTASNIYDIRSFSQSSRLSSFNTAIAATTLAVNCQGAESVMAFVNFTGAGMVLTLSNLQIGVPVVIYAENANAAAQTFKLAATAPSGTAYGILAKTSSQVNNMVTTGVAMAASNHLAFSGNSTSGPSLWFIVN